MPDQVTIVLNDAAELVSLLQGKSGGNNGYGGLRSKAVGTANDAQLFFNAGGLFVDCELSRPVFNTLIQPRYTLANLIPVKPTVEEKVKFGYLTQLSEGGTTPQDGICADPPSVGSVAICKAEFGIGRLSFQSNTMERDALIRRAHRGVHDDFYFVGDLRGVSAFPTNDQLGDSNFIMQSAVRRQMQFVLRRFQQTLSKWLWIGDPDAVSQNGTGGGWKSFYGLTYLVADDYGSKSFVSGTACTQLNSTVLDFTAGGVRDGIVGVDSLYEFLQYLEYVIYTKAAMMGLLPTVWRWVMHPALWAEAVKALPCDMVQDGCHVDGAVVNVNDGGNGMFNLAMRQQMMNQMAIETNGRRHEVVVDDAIPYIYDAGTFSYTSTIFFLPFVVAGEDALYWRHMNYNEFNSALAPIPNTQGDMKGWSDGGRLDWVIEYQRRCFVIDGKIEPALVFNAPHLAGRIDKVTVRTLGAIPTAFAGVVSYPLG